MYGGWTLVRDDVVAVFSHSNDVQYLTLLNLVDNYIPVVLSIYSVIFRGNNVDQYLHALMRCWVMLSTFRRRHYDKAMLIVLSMLRFFEGWSSSIVWCNWEMFCCVWWISCRKLPLCVERKDKGNWCWQHHGLQAGLQAKEIDSCKHDLHNFKSWFVPPRRFNLSQKRINSLKIKAAEFLNSWASSSIWRCCSQQFDFVPEICKFVNCSRSCSEIWPL